VSTTQRDALFKDVFQGLLQNRLLAVSGWRASPVEAPKHLFCVVQCLRLLMRERPFVDLFVQDGGFRVLATLLRSFSHTFFQGELCPYTSEILTEGASIAKKIVAESPRYHRQAMEYGVHETMSILLHTEDPGVLPSAIVVLLCLCDDRSHADQIADLNNFEVLLQITQEFASPFQELSIDLLTTLAKSPTVRAKIFQAGGLTCILSQIVATESKATVPLLKLLSLMLADEEGLSAVRDSGGIPIIVSLFGDVRVEEDMKTQLINFDGQNLDTISAQCLCLTLLGADDEAAYQIRQCNGVYLLGSLLSGLATGPKLLLKKTTENSLAMAHILRSLRYIFSSERNRKTFKRLFTPTFFSEFIDVGSYEMSLAPYEKLASLFGSLGEAALNQTKVCLEDINMFGGHSHKHVRDYMLLDVMGKGAFGCVYKARKGNSGTLLAMKALQLDVVTLFGATSEEKQAASGQMTSEVEILSNMDHPNIVKYFESFEEGNSLYIAMELVEGMSLQYYLNYLEEQKKPMEEEEVWNIFLQLCLALRYLHQDKRVVHRDLTPSNIMLCSPPQRVKLTDFGLARQNKSSSSMMNSVVGTMPYSCPEIIQHMKYSEKADIWSLGCILYTMMMLKSPFRGNNPLTLATVIVELDYPPVESVMGIKYSEELMALVPALLVSDPEERPCIGDVSQKVCRRMMMEVDRSHKMEEILEDKISKERDMQRHSEALALKTIDALQRANGERTPRNSSFEAIDQAASQHFAPQAQPGLSDGRSSPRGKTHTPFNSRGSAKVSIAHSKLQPMTDPLPKVLNQLHKILFIDQMPPTLERDARRSYIKSYKRFLFGQDQNAGNIKRELFKLLSVAPEVVCMHAPGRTDLQDTNVTYEALSAMMEDILLTTDFYAE